MKAVQSAITNMSFPATLDGIRDRVSTYQDWKTDLDVLLDSGTSDEGNWTAPRWVMEGDILFFYHTKSARRNVDRLLKEVNESLASTGWLKRLSNHKMRRMRSLLERSAERSSRYSGTIFGCAEISGPTEYFEREAEESPHFKGRLFAPIRHIHIFANPLPAAEFAEVVKIGQGAVTPLHGKQFDDIKRLLAKQNELPGFLENARIGGLTFRDVNQTNWPSISCDENIRFIDEAQIRAYLLDFLLNEVKDKGTPLLEECDCYLEQQRKKPDIADYFITIDGRWVPVEAKLNILAERDVLAQVAKYVDIYYFKPTRGKHRGKRFDANNSRVGMIADQSGLYIVSDNEFSDCRPGNPVWRRQDLNHALVPAIRERIEEELDE